MSTVTNYLRTIIARQVDDHGLVVWFDPEQHYGQFVQTLTLPDTTIVRSDGSFFALRRAIEPLISGDAPPRLLVYVPLAEEETHQALVAVTTMTPALLKPGQAAIQRNTRLAVVARRALKESLGPERADEVAKQVEAGKLTLADLDRLDEQQGGSAVIASLFGTASPGDVALLFLNDPRYDARLTERQATSEVATVMGRAFGVTLPPDAPPAQVRTLLGRHVLTTEFLTSLVPPLPSELETMRLPTDDAARQACVHLARTWRLRRDLQTSYVQAADQTEQALGLSGVAFTLAEIRDCHTFAGIEIALQAAIESGLLQHADPDLLTLVQQRQSSFWAEQRPDLRARWALIETAGLLVQEAQRIEEYLKQPPAQPDALFRAYTEGEYPWCLLDTYQRTLERRWHTFDLGDGTGYHTLEHLITRARQRFMDVGDSLAETFTRALAQAKCRLTGVPRQRDLYATVVRPAITAGKTAYVLVDALRFEMARDLAASLKEEFDTHLSAAMGTVPGITEIGMAALMPGAETNAQVVPTGDGKLGLQIGTVTLTDRRTRLDWFTRQVHGSVVITKLEEILPKPKTALQAELQTATVIVVTSQEIDELAERDNIRLARKVMDDILPDLARLVRMLREYGCQTIILTADHGYLFGDELESDMKVDPPGGQTIMVKRRVWVGRGGAADPAFLRAGLAQFGLHDDLDIAVPWGFGVFKAQGGARAYFHGGLSLQELAVPVMVLTPVAHSRVTSLTTIEWRLEPNTRKLTTRFFSVQIAGHSTGMFDLEPPRVRLEVRAKGEVISTPISATYGQITATNEIELRVQDDDRHAIVPNSVTLMVDPVQQKTVSVHLLDAATGRELKRLEKIEVAVLDY